MADTDSSTTVFLAAVDGSEGAAEAATFAAQRAKAEGATLRLVHVVDWSPYEIIDVAEAAARPGEREKEIATANQEILEPLVARLSDGIILETEVHHGHAAETIARIREQVGEGRVICGLSGGVDSSVTAALLYQALGARLSCILVDNGLLRKDEEAAVIAEFSNHFQTDLHVVDAEDQFLGASMVLSEELKKSGYAEGHLIPDERMLWIEGGIPTDIHDKLYGQQTMGPFERYGKVLAKGTFQYGGQYGHLGAYKYQISLSEIQLLSWYPPE